MSRRVTRIVHGIALLAVLVLGTPALALPVDLFMRPGFGFGFEADGLPADLLSGAATFPRPDSLFADPDGSLIRTSTLAETLIAMPAVPSRSDPSRLGAVFGFEAVGRDFQDLWVVIRGHATTTDPTGSFYATENFGLNVAATPGLVAFQPDPVGFPDVFHLAVFLGDLAVGERADVSIEYAIAQDLFLAGSGANDEDLFMGPQLLVGYMELASVPEPGGVLWAVAIGMGMLASRRRLA